jgi:hypothetical protein
MRVYVVRGRGVEPEGAGAWREWGGRGRERGGGFKCNGLYEKVIKVKADVAALLTFLVLCGFRHIS